MHPEWDKLQHWDGSKNKAFEELCCQLARCEQSVPQGSRFIRKGTPDAGLECFWELPNGDELGWQAKFFQNPPDPGRWSQIDSSVRTALEKHPRLVAYTICLPIDRSDPRIEGQKSFLDRWNERNSKWKGWASDRGMSVDFRFWGNHEIWLRLTRDEHRGRLFFWFSEEFLSPTWFRERVKVAISNAGDRYTPQLNVELPIAQNFERLARTPSFYNSFRVLYGSLRRKLHRMELWATSEHFWRALTILDKNVREVLALLEVIKEPSDGPIDFDRLNSSVSSSIEQVAACQEQVEVSIRKEKKEGRKPPQGGRSTEEEAKSVLYETYELTGILRELLALGTSTSSKLANVPSMLLVGKAGTGKTHLLCDLADQRVRANLPTVLLLGQQFSSREPWAQAISILGLSCTRNQFLGALDAAAEVAGSRALILIDALNEGDGMSLWTNYLAGMLTELLPYSRIGLVVSVRDSYERTVIPKGLVPDRLVRVEHTGFLYHEYEATKRFFGYFGIQFPSVPLLNPEFQNPLFLKLFCSALKNRGMTTIPRGLRGITATLDYYIDSINEKLARPDKLNFDVRKKIVHTAIRKLTEVMAEKNSRWLGRQEAASVVNAILPREGYENSLFSHLISEGLINEETFPGKEEGDWQEIIRFAYERYTDHLVAQYLLDKYLGDNPVAAFEPNEPLGSKVKDEHACWSNRGLVDAFSVQLPERLGKELAEVAPACASFRPVKEAFVESIVWRKPTSIGEATLKYVNEQVIQEETVHEQLLDALLTVAPDPEHPYNARFLHKNLMEFNLADRDSWWSVYIHNRWGNESAVDRLVDWAWSREDKSGIGDESIELCGIALCWFLTSSNRYLRDRATKALVQLLDQRLHVLGRIVQAFQGVDDPYVIERLYAAAYGCVLRSSNAQEIGKLAKEVYDQVFAQGKPSAHILLRDYARGVIETALHHKIDVGIDARKIRPPYASEWPKHIASGEVLKQKYGWYEGISEPERGRLDIYSSAMGWGDFATYVIEPSLRHWSSHKLGEPKKPSPKELLENFSSSLTSPQKQALKRFQNAVAEYQVSDLLKKARRSRANNAKRAVAWTEKALLKKLGKRKEQLFKQAKPYLLDPLSAEKEQSFDPRVGGRWIVQKVFDMGWTVDRFGRFDQNTSGYRFYGREANKPERIGKKYQWLALHEFLARVADNFEYRGEPWAEEKGQYEGPWQLYVRDIDPSIIIGRTAPADSACWWRPVEFGDWRLEDNDVDWLRDATTLPPPELLIDVSDPVKSSRWLVLEGHYSWEQPVPLEEEHFEFPRRRTWYQLRSYIVRKRDAEKLFHWAQKQHFMGRWMPESRDLHDVFLGECFWAPAFEYHSRPYFNHAEWTRGWNRRLPKAVLVATDGYSCESSGYDCSIEQTVHIMVPVKWLVDGMGLRWNGVEGHYYNERGDLVAYDPSVSTAGPGTLIIDRGKFLAYLERANCAVLWTVLGEKLLIGGSIGGEEWKGRLEISGAYRIKDGRVDGTVTPRFVSGS